MELKQAKEKRKFEDKFRVPSVTDSPIKHVITPKVESRAIRGQKKEEVLSQA